jgi:hypothetical protein
MRRFAHLIIVISLILVVRSCGGMAIAEDRMSATSQWVAQKTGMTAVRDKWRKDIAPAIAGTSRKASQGLQDAVRGGMQSIDSGAIGTRDRINAAGASVVSAVKNAFGGAPDAARPAGDAPAAEPGNSEGASGRRDR